jgi:hypothetical protein
MEPGTEPQHKVTPSLADDSGCIAIASPPKDPNPNIATFPEETDCISSPNIGPDNANAELTRGIVTSATNESTLVTEVRQLLDDPQYIESSQGNYGNAMEVLIQHGKFVQYSRSRASDLSSIRCVYTPVTTVPIVINHRPNIVVLANSKTHD